MPLISVEGIEASGKTTFSKALIDSLDRDGFKTLYTSDPAHDSVSGEIREMICTTEYRHLTVLMLVSAGRSNNYHEVIKPALDDGVIVVTDRFVLTSYVYHSHVCGKSVVRDLHNIAADSIRPWKTFIIDVSTDVAKARIIKRNNKHDLFDNAPMETLNRWRYDFLDANNKYKLASENGFIIMDGTKNVNDLVDIARQELRPLDVEKIFKK